MPSYVSSDREIKRGVEYVTHLTLDGIPVRTAGKEFEVRTSIGGSNATISITNQNYGAGYLDVSWNVKRLDNSYFLARDLEVGDVTTELKNIYVARNPNKNVQVRGTSIASDKGTEPEEDKSFGGLIGQFLKELIGPLLIPLIIVAVIVVIALVYTKGRK